MNSQIIFHIVIQEAYLQNISVIQKSEIRKYYQIRPISTRISIYP
jgi:hypothetical protein